MNKSNKTEWNAKTVYTTVTLMNKFMKILVNQLLYVTTNMKVGQFDLVT